MPCHKEVLSRRWGGVRGGTQRGGEVGPLPAGTPDPENSAVQPCKASNPAVPEAGGPGSDRQFPKHLSLSP